MKTAMLGSSSVKSIQMIGKAFFSEWRFTKGAGASQWHAEHAEHAEEIELTRWTRRKADLKYRKIAFYDASVCQFKVKKAVKI